MRIVDEEVASPLTIALVERAAVPYKAEVGIHLCDEIVGWQRAMIVQIGIVVGGVVESFSIDIERPLSHLLVEMVEELVAPARQIAGIDDADWGAGIGEG